MVSVEKCPTTLAEVNKSSIQMNCGFDNYGNSQYMCLPNVEKSSLVEFCYDGIMGIQKEGNCLVAKDTRVLLQNCESFSSGCPKKPFFNYEFYKFPACQDVNLKHFCYTLDPSCASIGNASRAVNNLNEIGSDDFSILYGLIGGLFLLILIGMVVSLIKWRDWERRLDGGRNGNGDPAGAEAVEMMPKK